MAEKKKTTSKSTSSKAKGKSTSSKSRSSSSKADTRSKQQVQESAELPSLGGGFWGVVLLALGVFMIISAFSEDGKFVAFFAQIVRGLTGWGFWLTVPAFLFAGGILLVKRDEPVGHRAVCALLLPVLFSGLAELLHPTEISKPLHLPTAFHSLYSLGTARKSAAALRGRSGKASDAATPV